MSEITIAMTRQEHSGGCFSRYRGGQTEAGVRPKRTTTKGNRELHESRFTTY